MPKPVQKVFKMFFRLTTDPPSHPPTKPRVEAAPCLKTKKDIQLGIYFLPRISLGPIILPPPPPQQWALRLRSSM